MTKDNNEPLWDAVKLLMEAANIDKKTPSIRIDVDMQKAKEPDYKFLDASQMFKSNTINSILD